MDRRLLGLALIVASAAGFASGSIFGKGVYAAGVDWMTLMAWRFLIGGTATWLWILASPRRRADVRRLDRRAVWVGFGLGVLYVGNSGTYYGALQHVSASLMALIVFVYPALVAVLSIRVGRRLEGRRAWTALGLALFGSALTIGGIEAGQVPPIGYLLIAVASPFIYACWIVIQAWLMGERPGRVAREATGEDRGSGAAAVAGLVTTGAALSYWSLAMAAGRPVSPADIPVDAWPGIIGIGFLSTFVAIVGFSAGSRLIGAAEASLVSTIEPVITVVLAALILRETLTTIQFVGGALILVGVVVAQTAPRPGDGAGRERAVLRIADE